jgi:6-phosphogluconolactonase
MRAEVRRFADVAALYAAGAAALAESAVDAVQRNGVFRVALAGGSTPKGMYSLLATDARLRSTIPWNRIDFFWSDERYVPAEHPDSNYGMAFSAMLSKVNVPPTQVHRVRTEDGAAVAVADSYAAEIRSALSTPKGIPRFDLIVLGIGADGHTASLFPGTDALHEEARLVTANWVDKFGAYRITMTFPLLNAARLVMFMAAGADKAVAVRKALEPEDESVPIPAHAVQPRDGQLLWLLDSAAASLLQVSHA